MPSKASTGSCDSTGSPRTESQSSSDLSTNLDQSCSSLPSQSADSSDNSIQVRLSRALSETGETARLYLIAISHCNVLWVVSLHHPARPACSPVPAASAASTRTSQLQMSIKRYNGNDLFYCEIIICLTFLVSQENALHEAQIPVWKRNGKFVNFFRSFIGAKSKEKVVKASVFGTELTKLLADTGDEGRQTCGACDVANSIRTTSQPTYYTTDEQ